MNFSLWGKGKFGRGYYYGNSYWGGLRWDIELSKRLDDPIFLERYGYKVYSQNDEDGIIQEIFKRIGTTNKQFIEFGVQDGLESNCHYLLFKRWSGLWIEGSLKHVNRIMNGFKSVINNGQLKVTNAFIKTDNINQIISDAGFKGEIDLLSIDIDGNDYHIWEKINVINPRVVIIEYNAKFPPDCEWIMPYKADHAWDLSDKFGASLKSFEILGEKRGYTLVGTNYIGVNAFFVRTDLVKNFFPTPATSENLYNPTRLNVCHKSGHRSMYCLVDDKKHSNVGISLKITQKLKRKIARMLTSVFHYYEP